MKSTRPTNARAEGASAHDVPPETIQLRRRSPIEQELRKAEALHRRTYLAGVATLAALHSGKPLPLYQFEDLAAELAQSVLRNHNALLLCSQAHNKESYTHALGTAVLMMMIAGQMRLSEDEICRAGLAGLLHDIGNFHVSPHFLHKPGNLTPEEFTAVSEHTVHGARLISRFDHDPDGEVADVVRHHHERVDGSGYPDRLDGAHISRLSRAAAVADAYDALTRTRVYHKALSGPVALKRLRETGAGKLDADMLEAMAQSLGPFPPGSLVRLSSQRLALVVEQNPERLQFPVVDVFYDARTRRRTAARSVDLAARAEDPVVGVEDAADWGLDLGTQLRESAAMQAALH